MSGSSSIWRKLLGHSKSQAASGRAKESKRPMRCGTPALWMGGKVVTEDAEDRQNP